MFTRFWFFAYEKKKFAHSFFQEKLWFCKNRGIAQQTSVQCVTGSRNFRLEIQRELMSFLCFSKKRPTDRIPFWDVPAPFLVQKWQTTGNSIKPLTPISPIFLSFPFLFHKWGEMGVKNLNFSNWSFLWKRKEELPFF